MNKDKNIGDRYGRLVVKSFSHKKIYKSSSKKYYNCICDCGKEVVKSTEYLKLLKDKNSCGCLKKEDAKNRILKKYIGEKFGILTVVSLYETKKYPSGGFKNTWRCQCDCGKIVEGVTTSALTSGNTKSCGCIHSKASVENSKKSRHKVAKKDSGLNSVYASYLSNANKRSLCFDLTKSDFKKITKSNCFYCGEEPSNKHTSSYYSYTYSGIDRIDNKIGYTKENCIPCCYNCNRAKNKMGLDDFLKWAVRVGRTAMRIKLSDLGDAAGIDKFDWMSEEQEFIFQKLKKIRREQLLTEIIKEDEKDGLYNAENTGEEGLPAVSENVD